MTTFRIKKKDNYSVIANAVINDALLSWGARGLLIYLLSKPDNWITRTSDLIKNSPAGERRVRTLIAELEKAGYMKRRRFHDEGGQWTWETDVHENPTILTFSTDGLPTDGKPQDIVKTDLKKTEGESNKKSKDKIKVSPAKAGKRKRPPRDERLDHPAIKEYRAQARLHAPVNWRDDIISAVGERSEEWGQHVKSWMGNGWNKGNIKGLLESWKNGGISKNGKATRNLSDEYRREADLAAAQQGIDEAKKYGKR